MMKVDEVPQQYRETWLRALLKADWAWVDEGGEYDGATSCVGNILTFTIMRDAGVEPDEVPDNLLLATNGFGLAEQDEYGSAMGSFWDPVSVRMLGVHVNHCDAFAGRTGEPHWHSVAEWNDHYGVTYWEAAIAFGDAWKMPWWQYLPESPEGSFEWSLAQALAKGVVEEQVEV